MIASVLRSIIAPAIALAMMPAASSCPAFAQEQTAPAPTAPAAQAPEPLSADELEVLVARIALYPDELVALISAASLYPLQIVEAARYLDAYAKDKSLKPKESWDGSVVSLLNYPEVVKMMSDDLDWTQALGDALAYQQKDVLIAIQQLRDEAVAKNIIKSDDKMNGGRRQATISSSSRRAPNKVYVPRYEPAMLYEPGYAAAPITYYPDPYPSYWYPTATFLRGGGNRSRYGPRRSIGTIGAYGAVTGTPAIIDVDCNNCLNNIDFNGKLNFKDVDWKNIDRSKLNFDRNQLAKLDRTNIKNRVEANRGKFDRQPRGRHQAGPRPANLSNRTAKAKDIRKSTLEGLKSRPGGDLARARPRRAEAGGAAERPGGRDVAQGERPAAGQCRPAAAGKPKVSADKPVDGTAQEAFRARQCRPRQGCSKCNPTVAKRPWAAASAAAAEPFSSGGGGRNMHRGGGGGRSSAAAAVVVAVAAAAWRGGRRR